ncbi:unnamed protein product [Pedinophyceae sp. YPF-701]|nr:unnamed protein product [Pedinophyceae sp. YPF-701]
MTRKGAKCRAALAAAVAAVVTGCCMAQDPGSTLVSEMGSVLSNFANADVTGELAGLLGNFDIGKGIGPLRSKLFGVSNAKLGGAGTVIPGTAMQMPTLDLGGFKANLPLLDISAAMATAADFASDYCTPFTYLEPEKIDAKITGPSLNIVASTGTCRVDVSGDDGIESDLTCVGPSVVATKVPPIFTHKHKSAACLITPECTSTQQFGNTVEVELFGKAGETFSFPLADLRDRGGFKEVMRKMLSGIVEPSKLSLFVDKFSIEDIPGTGIDAGFRLNLADMFPGFGGSFEGAFASAFASGSP